MSAKTIDKEQVMKQQEQMAHQQYTQDEAETLGAVDETAMSLEDALAAEDETFSTNLETTGDK
jgi:hypothetical protein